MYSDRDKIQIEREIQTEGFAKKTEEITERVTEIPGRKRTAQEVAADEAVHIVQNSVQQSYRSYVFCTTTCGRPYCWPYSHAEVCWVLAGVVQ